LAQRADVNGDTEMIIALAEYALGVQIPVGQENGK
jgi:hypothetical protein